MQNIERVEPKTSKLHNPVRISLAVTSVAAALVAIFPLSLFAILGPLEHAAQHLMIFGGGIGLGASIFIPDKKEG